MCGIAGVVGPVGAEHRRLVREMCLAMRHRGPDDEGYFDGEGVCLGMRRLAIIDVAHGKQPVTSEDGSVVAVFNGELYNFRQLQEYLRSRGHRLGSESDSECFPHLYEEFGPSYVRQLRGMFAAAVWDTKTKTLNLVRDRVGKKPLYLWQEGERLWFASELKCLMTLPGFSRELDVRSLYLYLTFGYVPAPYSIFRGVRKLEPAHQLRWESGQSEIKRYWTLDYAPPEGAREVGDPAELAAELRALIVAATERRMVSDRPLGAFLSGGLDSSAVVGAMAHLSGPRVPTYSIGFGNEEFNELPYARQVAQIFDTDHHELVVQPDVVGLLPRLVRSFDEPFADSSAIPSYYVAEMAKSDVVVALNGDGGDESLGGYDRYRRFLRRGVELPMPALVAKAAGYSAESLRRRTISSPRLSGLSSQVMRAAAVDAPSRYGRQMSFFTPEELRRVIRSDHRGALREFEPYAAYQASWKRHREADLVNRLLAVDVENYLPGDLLPKVDITTMAVSLEARSPFLDQELMEWAACLPGITKVSGGSTKWLLKRALEPWLPSDLIHRKKQGFAIPLQRWLSGELKPMVEDVVLAPDARCHDFLERAEVKRIAKVSGQTGATSGQLWALLMLELFLRGLD